MYITFPAFNGYFSKYGCIPACFSGVEGWLSTVILTGPETGGNYEKGMYNYLMEVMARLDTVERESKKETIRLNDEISGLKEKTVICAKKNSF